MNIVMKYEIEGRILSEPFMKLPSRRELPDYYEVIKKPLDIKKIMSRIDEAKYIDFADLEKDFFQLCQNAQIYNEDTSLIYDDSIALQNIFTQAKQKVAESDETEDDDVDDSDSSDSESMKMKLSKHLSKASSSKDNSSSSSKKTPARRKKIAKKYINSDDDDDDDDMD